VGLVDFSLGDVGGVFTSIREAITGEKIKDPAEMAKVELQLQQLEAAARTGQLAINREEAKSSHLFVAGWRPFIGWGCGFALLYAALFEPLLHFIAVVFFDFHGDFPAIDPTLTMPVLLAMLGMGAMRSHDKKHGIDTKGK